MVLCNVNANVFLRVWKAISDSSSHRDHWRRAFAVYNNDPTPEICFLQWYVVIENSALPVDGNYSALNSVGMSWHRSDGVPGILDSGREYGFVCVKSIRVLVHVFWIKILTMWALIMMMVGNNQQRQWVPVVVGGATSNVS